MMQSLKKLESDVENTLRGEDKMIDEIREVIRCAKIKREYKQELQNRWGESKQIMFELSLKYYNTPYKTDFIHDVIYRKYR